jgi:hypothetical protein
VFLDGEKKLTPPDLKLPVEERDDEKGDDSLEEFENDDKTAIFPSSNPSAT